MKIFKWLHKNIQIICMCHLMAFTIMGAILFLALFNSCGGLPRDAIRVDAYQRGDDELHCYELKQQMADFKSKYQAQKSRKGTKIGTNIVWLISAVFVPPMVFLIDASDVDNENIETYRNRYQALAVTATEKGCKDIYSIDSDQFGNEPQKIVERRQNNDR